MGGTTQFSPEHALTAHRETHITVSDRILAATFLKLLPRRVTPNQITIFRFFTVPFVAVLLFLEEYRYAIPLFAVSAFTDALDGALARTKDKITEWGKAFDPIADKLLIGTTALLVIPQFASVYLFAIIVFLEMFLIGTAYYLRNQGHDISANGWGKTKMILQSFGVGFILLFALAAVPWMLTVGTYLLYVSIFFAIISLITYGI